MGDSREFIFNDLKPGEDLGRIIQWKIKPGSRLDCGSIIALYRPILVRSTSSDEPLCGDERKLKAAEFGTVTNLLKNPNDILRSGDVLLTYEPCSHPEQIIDMCTMCGMDLRKLTTTKKELAAVRSVASVSMLHSIPDLKVSQQEAEKLGKADEERLLRDRKLVLLVDLDQTLIHTTNDIVYNKSGSTDDETNDEYVTFQLVRNSPVYRTRVRPFTQQFLDQIDKLYEMHICTFGARLYAHKIANILDPPPQGQIDSSLGDKKSDDKKKKKSDYKFDVVGSHKYFSHRILSRDECLDPLSKTGNMKGLFPCGDSMVAIIDDREDVWNYAPNLIQVTPYVYFKGTGDINAPEKNSQASDKSNKSNAETTPKSAKEETKEEQLSEKKENLEESCDKLIKDSEESVKMPDDADKPSEPEEVEAKESPDKESPPEPAKDSDTNTEITKKEKIEDFDDYLLYLIDILKRIHKSFYEEYDDLNKHLTSEEPTRMPDMKKIIPTLRKSVLSGVNLAFSSVIPNGYPPERSRIWRIARSLGANPQKEIVTHHPERTTHLMCGKMGTNKVHKALSTKGKIKLINPLWLYACNERWERADESLFSVSKEDDYTSSEFRSKLGLTQDQEAFITGSNSKRERFSHLNIPQDEENTEKTNSRKASTSSQDPAVSEVRYDEKTGKRIRPGLKIDEKPSSKSDSKQSTEIPTPESNRQKMSDISPLSVFSFADLRKMDKEVEDAVSEASGDTDDDDSSSESSANDENTTPLGDTEEDSKGISPSRSQKRKRKSHSSHTSSIEKDGPESSDEGSLTGEFPKGWESKRHKKRKSNGSNLDKSAVMLGAGDEDEDESTRDSNFETRCEELFGSEDSSSQDADSIGSVDEELAAAVEREFLN